MGFAWSNGVSGEDLTMASRNKFGAAGVVSFSWWCSQGMYLSNGGVFWNRQ